MHVLAIEVQGIPPGETDTTAWNIGTAGIFPERERSTSQARDEGTFLYVGG